MDSSLLRQFSQVFTKGKIKFNQRLAVFLFFLIVSSILWYLIKLSQEYTTALNHPVRFTNMPKGKIMVGDPPSRISLNVKAFGYTLLRYKMSTVLSSIEIDLKKSNLRTLPGYSNKYFITSSSAQSSVAGQLSSYIKLESISPDTLYFEFARVAEKRVKVEPKVYADFERQFMQRGRMTVNPDSIIVSGPKTIVDTIRFVVTKPLKLSELNATWIKSIRITPISQVGFSAHSTTITIPVEKFTEASLRIPVEAVNVPDNLKLTLMPAHVDLRCNVVLSQYFNLKPRFFKAQVDYNLVGKTPGTRLRVSLTSYPEYIEKIDYSPKFVEYIIEKK